MAALAHQTQVFIVFISTVVVYEDGWIRQFQILTGPFGIIAENKEVWIFHYVAEMFHTTRVIIQTTDAMYLIRLRVRNIVGASNV